MNAPGVRRRWPVVREFFVDLVRVSVSDRVAGVAAEVTFFAVLSIFPGLLILAAAVARLDAWFGREIARGAEAALLGAIDFVLTDQATIVHDTVSDLFHRDLGGLLTTATLFALWSLSSGFVALIDALEMAYKVKQRRSWLRKRAKALGWALGSLVVLVLLIVGVVLGPTLGARPTERIDPVPGLASVWGRVGVPLAFVVFALGATTLYWQSPKRKDAWWDHLPGGTVAAFLGVAASSGFNAYLRLAVEVNPVLSVLGGGLILLIWLYLLTFVVLLGGEVNAVLGGRHR